MSINAVQNKVFENFKPRLDVNKPLNPAVPDDSIDINALIDSQQPQKPDSFLTKFKKTLSKIFELVEDHPLRGSMIKFVVFIPLYKLLEKFYPKKINSMKEFIEPIIPENIKPFTPFIKFLCKTFAILGVVALVISEILNPRLTKTDNDAQKVIDESIKLKGVDPKFVAYKKQSEKGFDPATGNITIPPKYGKDIVLGLLFKPILKNGSKNAEQYALISMLPGGIESLNMLYVKKVAKSLSPKEKNEIITAYKLLHTVDNRNTNTKINDATYKMAAALYALSMNPNITKEQLPMVIDKSFYEKVKQAHGPLTQEEEKKAREYLKNYTNKYKTQEKILLKQKH